MKNSKLIALSAVSTALALIFLTLGVFLDVFDLSGLFMASMCVMLPLGKKSVKAGFFTYLATAILCLIFFVGIKYEIVLGYALFCGVHPIINYIFRQKKFNVVLGGAIKTVWFVGVLLLLYTVSKNFLFSQSILDNEIFQRFAYLILTVLGGAVFLIYDFIMFRFQRAVDLIVVKLKL